MKPGVQNPHWNAPASMNASCTGLEHVALGEVLDRLHLGTVGERREVEAAGHGSAVHHHGAAAAQPLAAAFARAEQIELVLQHLDEVVMRLDLGADAFAVERELNRT